MQTMKGAKMTEKRKYRETKSIRNPRSKTVSFRVTKDEWETLSKAVKDSGMTLAEFCTEKCVYGSQKGSQTVSADDLRVLVLIKSTASGSEPSVSMYDSFLKILNNAQKPQDGAV